MRNNKAGRIRRLFMVDVTDKPGFSCDNKIRQDSEEEYDSGQKNPEELSIKAADGALRINFFYCGIF
jgi:hypothetical protein